MTAPEDRPPEDAVPVGVDEAINGHAIGPGMTPALRCDFRFLAERARWGVVQVRRGRGAGRGIAPDAGAGRGHGRCGGGAVGRSAVPRPRGTAAGAATRCLPAADVLAEATTFAQELAPEAAPLPLALCKQILWASADSTLAEVDARETAAHRLSMGAPRWPGSPGPAAGTFSPLPPID